MNFEPLNLTLPDYNAAATICIVFITCALASLVGIIAFLATGVSVKKKIIGTVILLAALTGFAFTAINVNNDFNQSVRDYNAYNKKTATDNLMKKYNVKEVNWDSSDTTVGTLSTSGDGDLRVVLQDDSKYIFKYRVNKDNSEPFLEDMPIRGGTVPASAVTAKSLLK